MNPVFVVCVVIIGAFVAAIVGEALWAVRKERRDAAIRRYREAGWAEGFAAGADLDAKTRRIGERAARFGR